MTLNKIQTVEHHMYSFFGSGYIKILKLGIASLVIVIFAWSCSTTEKSTKEQEPREEEAKVETEKEKSEVKESGAQAEINLASYRSDMADVYKSQRQTIPESFAYRDTTEEVDENPNAGYRIQITSTRKVTEADSAASKFKNWYNEQKLDSTLSYQPESYIFFKQPYYRVQIGDFKERNMAIGFAQLVKQKYPDAWIVHDRIKVDRVPADSINKQLSEFR